MSWRSTIPTPEPKAPGWSTVIPSIQAIIRPGWIGHRKTWRTAQFSGGGGLEASAVGRHSVSAVSLSGAGSLLAQLMVRNFRNAGLYGQGTLTAAALGPVFRDAEFSGGGYLSAAALGPQFVDVDFSGEGELGWDRIDYPRFVNVEFNGQGLLGADAEATEFQPLPDGLSATTTQQYLVLAAFAGSGELTIALSEIEHALGPNFVGAGELSAVVTQIQQVTADLSGGGQLQAIASHLAALQGSGTLSAQAFELLVALRDAALSGAGQMTGVGHERFSQPAAAGGSGTMSATVSQIYTVPIAFDGGGSLAASVVKQVFWKSTGAGFNYTTNEKTDTGSFVINADADDYVVVFISGDDDSSPSVTLQGSAMTNLGQVSFANNSGQEQLYAYGRLNTASGNRTVEWTGTAPGTVVLNAVAYGGFGSVAAVTTETGAGGTAAHNVSSELGDIIVQAFGADQATWTPGGGTVRSDIGTACKLIISDSVVPENFTASGSIGNWASIAVVLRSA